VFERLGAQVQVIGDRPDGTNINAASGSTDPAELSGVVARVGADLGIAFDGDADRMIAVDGDGAPVSGDHVLALFATDLRARGALANDTVVVTVMTNLGFHRAMAAEGVQVVTTAVGDRSVLEALDSGGHSLGGEQSGHIIFADLATTGDGLLAGVLLAELGDEGRVLVRPSGTEPVVRVMVEAIEPGHAERSAQVLAAAVREAAGS
jgi:phosphoglucosamine mutase